MVVECENCGKEFQNEYKLTRHLNRKYPCIPKVTDDNIIDSNGFTCDKCGRIFNRKFNLTRHQIQNPDCFHKVDKFQESYYQNLIQILIHTITSPVADEYVNNLWNSVSLLCLVKNDSAFAAMWHIIQELSLEQISFLFLEYKHTDVHPNILNCIQSVCEHLYKLKSENKSEKIKKKNINKILTILETFLNQYK